MTLIEDALLRFDAFLQQLFGESYLITLGENIFADIVFALMIGFFGLLVTQRAYSAIRKRIRAATIRKAAGNGFVLVRCAINNDENGTIAAEIDARLEEKFRALSGSEDNQHPFEVMSFPLSLPHETETKSAEKAKKLALKWLERTNGDMIIWGRYHSKGTRGTIRIVGRTRSGDIFDSVRINFDSSAKKFDDALLNAIAIEMAEKTSFVLQDPDNADLESICNLETKFRQLSKHDAPALSDDWRSRVSEHADMLLAEYVKRVVDKEEVTSLEESLLQSFDPSDPSEKNVKAGVQLAMLANRTAHLKLTSEIRDKWLMFLEKAAFGETSAQLDPEVRKLAAVEWGLMSFYLDPETRAAETTRNKLKSVQEIAYGESQYKARLFALSLYHPSTEDQFSELTKLFSKDTSDLAIANALWRKCQDNLKHLVGFEALQFFITFSKFCINTFIRSNMEQGLHAWIFSVARHLQYFYPKNDEEIWFVTLATSQLAACNNYADTMSEGLIDTYFSILEEKANQIHPQPFDKTGEEIRKLNAESTFAWAEVMSRESGVIEFTRPKLESLQQIVVSLQEVSESLTSYGADKDFDFVVLYNNITHGYRDLTSSERSLELIREQRSSLDKQSDEHTDYIEGYIRWQRAELLLEDDPNASLGEAKKAKELLSSSFEQLMKADEVLRAKASEGVLRNVEAIIDNLSN